MVAGIFRNQIVYFVFCAHHRRLGTLSSPENVLSTTDRRPQRLIYGIKDDAHRPISPKLSCAQGWIDGMSSGDGALKVKSAKQSIPPRLNHAVELSGSIECTRSDQIQKEFPPGIEQATPEKKRKSKNGWFPHFPIT
jgi:hypothetical protein